jgi:hypothetical protein
VRPQLTLFVCSILLASVTAPSIAQGVIVTLHLRDSTSVMGELVSVTDSSVALPGELVAAPELGHNVFRTVPRILLIPQIQTITFQETLPGNATVAEKIAAGTLGCIVGLAAGGEIAYLSIGHPRTIDEGFQGIAEFTLGCAIGAGAGTYLAVGIVDHTRTTELAFDPSDRNQRDALRQYARERGR